ncbi:MAG TPA: hypothetical protein PK228_20700 [Saprospiraceae bacterium]|nr:hypothetical protein [Saprospiraceae bacterium]
MKFFKPQVQLARESVLDEPDLFYLHVVTFCPRTRFREDGHEIDLAELSQNRCKVSVKLREDSNVPDFFYITPVVHTFPLTGVVFPGGEGEIEVQVVGAVLEAGASGARSDPPTTTTKTGGKDTVSTTTADTNPRPISSELE